MNLAVDSQSEPQAQGPKAHETKASDVPGHWLRTPQQAQPRSSVDLSIVMISYNTAKLTRECLESVFAQTSRTSFEVIVVDNDSSDDSAQLLAQAFANVAVLGLEENLGFGRANNLAAKFARGRRLLLLNTDTVVKDRAIDKFQQFADEHAQAQMWAGRTSFPDGRLNRGSCWGAPTLWSTFCLATGLSAKAGRRRLMSPELMPDFDRDEVRPVEVVSGCYLLIDQTLWQKLEGFDPAFFMYGEDFDLCIRARQLGADPLFCPEGEIVHYGGASDVVKADQLSRQMQARIMLMDKHWSAPAARVGRWLIKLRVWVRAKGFGLASRWRGGSEAKAAGWAEAWSRRREWADKAR